MHVRSQSSLSKAVIHITYVHNIESPWCAFLDSLFQELESMAADEDVSVGVHFQQIPVVGIEPEASKKCQYQRNN